MGISLGSLTSITVIRTGTEIFHTALLIIQEVHDVKWPRVQYVWLVQEISSSTRKINTFFQANFKGSRLTAEKKNKTLKPYLKGNVFQLIRSKAIYMKAT